MPNFLDLAIGTAVVIGGAGYVGDNFIRPAIRSVVTAPNYIGASAEAILAHNILEAVLVYVPVACLLAIIMAGIAHSADLSGGRHRG